MMTLILTYQNTSIVVLRRYDDLLAAEEKALKTGKGLHDKKNVPVHRVSDMSGNAVKCKQFLPFLQVTTNQDTFVQSEPNQ